MDDFVHESKEGKENGYTSWILLVTTYNVLTFGTFRWCAVKLRFSENLSSQMEHLCGSSPVWVLRCLAKILEVVKARSHTGHLNGFSFAWIDL